MRRFLAWIRSLFASRRRTSALPDSAAAPPGVDTAPNAYALPTSDEDIRNRSQQSLDQLLAESETAVAKVGALYDADALAEPVREESIEEARKILRWLRNMEFTERDIEEFLDQGAPATQSYKKKSLHSLVLIFAAHLQQMLKAHPEKARHDPAILNARSAAAAVALMLAEHTRALMDDNDPRMVQIDALIDALPAGAELRSGQSVIRLIETIELGLDRVAGKQISDLSPVERMVEMSKRIEKTAWQLRSGEPTNTHAREESLELGREILRRLQNPSYDKKTMGEFIEKTKPEDKAAFAQQVSEMVDVYSNLLSQAASSIPGIRDDAAIKAANDAVGSFSHAIKLMAAKEMPNSLASAQQISAEAASMPEEWKDVHHRVVGRLLKSAEGGMEKAIEEIAAQQEQQQQQQNEEAEQDAIESAVLHSDHSKKKKKRRAGGGGTGRSGKGGGKKQIKQTAMAHAADNRVLKEGQLAQETKKIVHVAVNSTPAISNLKPADLEAIAKLGLGNQLKMMDVSAGDKIMPDNKSAAELVIDKEKQKHLQKKTQGPLV